MKIITLATSLIILGTWTTLTSFTNYYPQLALCILIIHIKHIVGLDLSWHILIYHMWLPFPRLVISSRIFMSPLGFIFPLSEELLYCFCPACLLRTHFLIFFLLCPHCRFIVRIRLHYQYSFSPALTLALETAYPRTV